MVSGCYDSRGSTNIAPVTVGLFKLLEKFRAVTLVGFLQLYALFFLCVTFDCVSAGVGVN